MSYSKIVIDLFIDPENEGELEDADGVGEAANQDSADFFKIMLKVNNKGIIDDIKFSVFSCCEGVSAGSMTTILAKGKTIREAEKISEQDLLTALNGLPKDKIYCANLAVTALKKALEDYGNNSNNS
ncbi:MAG: iron-sulfur cluster assembly scaffold protein [Bacillota bacterium]|jgi:nitrogen fixation NifU-like protein